MTGRIRRNEAAGEIGWLRRAGRALKAGWLRFAGILHRVNTTVILTLIYFVVIAPINLFTRLLGADLLNRRIGDEPSFWMDPESPSSSLDDCRRQF
jgi:hypothetical protein